ELDLEVERGHAHALGARALEPHLDPRGRLVPQGDVPEAGEAEGGAELAVEAGEDVAVEGGGHPGGVVVGGQEDRRVLAQIGAEEEAIAGREVAAGQREELGGGLRRPVADARADEEQEARAGCGGDARRELLDAAEERPDLELGAGQRVAGGGERGGRDVDRQVGGARARRRAGAGRDDASEQDAGLAAAAGAELDDRARGTGERGDLVAVRLEDRDLGAREVVLGEPRDLLEQARALVVVEEVRRQPPRRRAQPRGDVRLHVCGRPRGGRAARVGGAGARGARARRALLPGCARGGAAVRRAVLSAAIHGTASCTALAAR